MGSSLQMSKGTVHGYVCSYEYESRYRWGNPLMVVRYWAQIEDQRDAQRPIICCPHEHREPEAALPCLKRLFRIATLLALPRQHGTYAVKVGLSPEQIRDATKQYFSARA